MHRCRVCAVFIAVAVILSAFLCSCSSKPEIAETDTEKLRELADILGTDLTEKILPQIKEPDSLTDYDYVVSGKGYAKGTEMLAIFFADYKAKSDCEVTLILTNGSFVVSRIIFVDGKGYYLRYEYNEQNPKSLEVRGQTITSADLKYQKVSSKWMLKIFDGNKQRASFTLDG